MMRASLPGSTLGILGGGQLGRMFAIAARRMGYRVRVLTDAANSPGAQLADESVIVALDDPGSLSMALDGVSVLTYETENLPLDFVQQAAERVPLRPGIELLRLSQHRWLEKSALRDMGLPTADFQPVRSLNELRSSLQHFSGQGVLKTTVGGYDGKGQWMIRGDRDVDQAADAVKRHLKDDREQAMAPVSTNTEPLPRLIMEKRIDFELEFSVIAARSADGEFTTYGPMLNLHHDHILDISICPADLGKRVDARAHEIIRCLADKLNVVGLFCIEFFLTSEGDVLINEVAPRTHNSGHLTIESHTTCQFAQQVRAITGLPLGTNESMRPAAMANLLGDLWFHHDQSPTVPCWDRALQVPGVSLHLYGKKEARRKRKMGHLTVIANSSGLAVDRARMARNAMRVG